MDRINAASSKVMVGRVANSKPWRWLAIACAAYLATQVLPLTRIAYAPQQVSIDGGTVTLYRWFPGDVLGLPRPRVSYIETVRPLTTGHNGGHPCEQRGGPFHYDGTSEVGEWSIAWAAPCLSDPNGYVWRADWTWHIGQFTVGPTSLSHRVLKNKGERQ